MIVRIGGRAAEVEVELAGGPEDAFVRAGAWIDTGAALTEADCDAAGHRIDWHSRWFEYQMERAEWLADARKDNDD